MIPCLTKTYGFKTNQYKGNYKYLHDMISEQMFSSFIRKGIFVSIKLIILSKKNSSINLLSKMNHFSSLLLFFWKYQSYFQRSLLFSWLSSLMQILQVLPLMPFFMYLLFCWLVVASLLLSAPYIFLKLNMQPSIISIS